MTGSHVSRRASLLTVALSTHGRRLQVHYNAGSGAQVLTVDYPFETTRLPDAVWRAIGLGAATYLAGLCLAPRVRLTFPVEDGGVEAVQPLLRMLYDVRRWKDGEPLVDPPEITYPVAHSTSPGALSGGISPDHKRALLLFSGGKDSTLGAVLLRANGFTVHGLHVPVNAGSEAAEQSAADELAPRLRLPLGRLGYRDPHFPRFSRAHATPGAWDDYPVANRVPFGRDLLLCLLAMPAAAVQGAGMVSLGHDNECRNAYFEYGGRCIPRNDVESVRGAVLLEEFARRYVYPGVSLLPPVAGLSELRILHAMLVGHPDLMARTSFCFWGRSCGRCAKCLRYYLAQRYLGVDVLEFAVNPLSHGGAPELDDLLQLDGVGLLFQRQVLLCLGRLVQRGDRRAGEDRLAAVAGPLLDRIAPQLDDWEHELAAVRDDPQLPSGYSYASLPPWTASTARA